MRRSRQSGQAGVELIALIPVLVVVALLVLQLAALVDGALIAQDRVRAAAVEATGAGLVTVTTGVTVPSLVPGVGGLHIPARAAVRAP